MKSTPRRTPDADDIAAELLRLGGGNDTDQATWGLCGCAGIGMLCTFALSPDRTVLLMDRPIVHQSVDRATIDHCRPAACMQYSWLVVGLLGLRDGSIVVQSIDCCTGEQSTSSAAQSGDHINWSNGHSRELARSQPSSQYPRKLICFSAATTGPFRTIALVSHTIESDQLKLEGEIAHEQAGFRPRRCTRDQITNLWIILEKARKRHQSLSLLHRFYKCFWQAPMWPAAANHAGHWFLTTPGPGCVKSL